MERTTVSSKGQIVIPKPIRDLLQLTPGTALQIDVQGETLVMKRIAGGYPHWRTMRGMLRSADDLFEELAKERAAELAHEDERTKGA
jgi:AbrB family looped-hinge helix DNA binding protein